MESEEVWRLVPEFGGRYEVSNKGNLRSCPGGRVKVGRILAKKKAKNGYWNCCIRVGTKWRRRNLHRLVTAAFLGPCPAGLQVNHKDGDKNNNALENLEYVTQSENTKHAYRLHLLVHKLGSKWHASKLVEDEVAEIRRRASLGEKQRDLAAEFEISEPTLSEIVNNKYWKHV